MEAISPPSTEECDINTLNTDGESFLHIACRNGHLNCVKTLEFFYRYIGFKNTKDTKDAQNSFGDTPLHLACYGNSINVVRIVRILLEMKCSTNIPNTKGETARDIPLNKDGDCLLHIACQWGDVDIVRYLINDERCNPNVQSSTSENTPLHIAAKYGQNSAIVQLLSYKLCNPNPQNKQGDSPLHVACYSKSLDTIKLLLQRKCSTNIPNKKGETAQDIPLNEDGDCLLHIACQWGDVGIVRYLITNKRCNPSIQRCISKNTPLHIAAKYGQEDTIVQLFSCKECDPNAQNREGDTPLHVAAALNRTVVISKLLAHQQCNINAQNKKGDAPLHVACYKRSLDVVKLLLEMRCSTNIPNKKGETAQDVPLNEDGDCLLHIACQWGDVDIVRYLITDERCNPNVLSSSSENTPLHINARNMDGDTPLHIACYGKNLSIIRFFLKQKFSTNIPNKKGETAQDIPLNEDGDCLLHIACQWGDLGIVRYLINDERCNPSIQSSTSKNTPLHIAAKYGQDDTIVQLLSYRECNLIVQNKEGDTPLHFAASWNKTAAILKLLGDQQCNINVQNNEGNTPLQLACYKRSLDVVKLLLKMRCSTNIPNKKGETAQDIPLNEDGDCLLHIACQWGDVDTVRYLINDERCNPSIQSCISKNTPLHIAAEFGQEDTIDQLFLYKECDPNAQNKEGDTPLHIAVRRNKTAAISKLLAHQECNPNVQNKEDNTTLHIAVRDNMRAPAVSQLLTSKQCNLNVMNEDHLTPLLTAIKHNNCTTATAVLQHKDCDATLCDPHGNTPLHLACIGGETQPEMVKVAKQLLTFTDVDPSCVNNAGQTPIELTTNYQLIQAITHMVECKTNHPVQTYISVFIVGNPETGKSTLCKEATSILWKIVPKKMRRVKNVPLHTAGIIPTTFRSKTFGNAVLYDLAGQVEYYTSHAAVIRSTVVSTPPAFVVVVNLSESEEKISQTLRYWWSFIDNHAARSSAPPQVILAGSHADVVKSTGKSVHKKMTRMSALLKKLPASFHFAGQVALDCRDPASKELKLFCTLVNQSCTVLREKADVDLRCHVLYALLLDRFKGKVACTVSDVATSVKETSELLLQDSTSLILLISTLSDKGLILLVKGGESHGGWWIILQKHALLSEVNGAIFAPKNFSQHKDLSWSTGVVPFSKLKTEFPDYNPNMVSKFLIHLEFCFKIEDHETLALLKDEASNVKDTSPDPSEEYYFFPALVSVENPLDIWEENDNMCCKCGWLYKCIRHDQFLTTQFLHVLILRLAFTFALKLSPGDCCEDALALRRRCSVWKHGIAWLNREPIETVVEVGLQHQSVVVMMRCPKGKEAECVQLRSEVIQKVLEAKDKCCEVVDMSESFIHPTDVNYPFNNEIEDSKYSLTEIALGIVNKTANVLDRRGRNPIPVQDLLLFHPHTTDSSPELLSELFSEKHSMDETVRSQVLGTLNSASELLLCVHLYKFWYKNLVFSPSCSYSPASCGIQSNLQW